METFNPKDYRILVIDDEESICDILKFNLEREGFNVDCCFSAVDALERDLTSYSLFIVDIMMERLTGYDFIQCLRSNLSTEKLPVIMCSALDDEDDKVTGLNTGADDYISKPFSTVELVARVKAVLRRSAHALTVNKPASGSKTDYSPDLNYKTIRIDQNEKVCYIDGMEVPLTRTEYDILVFFLNHRNRIYSRNEIIREVWSPDVLVSERAIDTNLTRLRKKLGDYSNNIITRQGFGYGFKETY